MPEPKPVLIYDGRCGFCKLWLNYWRQLTGDRVEYIASQDVGDRFPQIPSSAYTESVQLVRADGSVVNGARAVFETLNLLWLYGPLAVPSEIAYRIIAKRRNFFYHVTRFTFGKQIEPTRFQNTQWLFLRVLALIYASAFVSLSLQVSGLIGSQGILPLGEFLNSVMQQSPGPIRYLAVPTLFWFGFDDHTLTGLAGMGIVLSLLLFVTGFRRGRLERLILVMLFVLYLSFSSAGQEFLSFQWDSLLIESGFLAIFLGRNRIVPWLFRWLVFRLILLSGSVKLLSQDPTWRHLTALQYHFHTQPLPTAFAWYAEKLPPAFLRFSTWMVLAIELATPFLIFMPRRLRIFGAWWMIGLQAVIFLTGNYAFFNLLTVALCLFLFDDQALSKFVPSWVRNRRTSGPLPRFGARPGSRVAPAVSPAVNNAVTNTAGPAANLPAGRVENTIAWALAVVIVTLGVGHFVQTFRGRTPEPLNTALRYTAPLQIVNTYGLFAVMTTVRNEIVIEGSDDAEHWLPYQLPFKPQDLNRVPRWAAPYQPRLDWQMWFAALGNYQSNPWFVGLTVRLLQGSQGDAGLGAVPALFAERPFINPPKYIRASLFEYTFTDFETRRRTGAWWQRVPKGLYLPAVTLRGGATH